MPKLTTLVIYYLLHNLQAIADSPRGSAPLNRMMSVTETGPVVDFNKMNLETEATMKENLIDKETKEMFQAAYTKIFSQSDLSKENLRSLFGSLEDRAFEDVYCLFDWDKDGSVDMHEFVMTMCLLATPATSLEGEQDLLFAIFDVDGSGTIDREEFGKMMRATLRCKMTHLDFCMKNDERKHMFRKHLEGEYNSETLEFYTAVDEYRSMLEGFGMENVELMEPEELAELRKESNEVAESIYAKFVKDCAPSEVNLSGRVKQQIKKDIEECRSTKPFVVPFTIYDQAQQEIYHLMNRDTFERFKNNDELLNQMLISLFNEVDVDRNGTITLDEYKNWVKENPELTNFLKDLHDHTFVGVKKAAGLEGRKQRRLSVKHTRQMIRRSSNPDLLFEATQELRP